MPDQQFRSAHYRVLLFFYFFCVEKEIHERNKDLRIQN